MVEALDSGECVCFSYGLGSIARVDFVPGAFGFFLFLFLSLPFLFVGVLYLLFIASAHEGGRHE